MVLIDLLSRMEGDKIDLYEVIPILFNFHSILTEYYFTISNLHKET